jgi:hypothetical protein
VATGPDRRNRDDDLGRLLDRVDLLGDLDDVGAGGVAGLGAGLDVAADALHDGPAALEVLEGANDLGDALDDLL